MNTEIIVQFNGKQVGRIEIPSDADRQSAVFAAMNFPKIKKEMGERVARKVIYVPGRIINIVE